MRNIKRITPEHAHITRVPEDKCHKNISNT